MKGNAIFVANAEAIFQLESRALLGSHIPLPGYATPVQLPTFALRIWVGANRSRPFHHSSQHVQVNCELEFAPSPAAGAPFAYAETEEATHAEDQGKDG
jgi:hypothetical protein